MRCVRDAPPRRVGVTVTLRFSIQIVVCETFQTSSRSRSTLPGTGRELVECQHTRKLQFVIQAVVLRATRGEHTLDDKRPLPRRWSKSPVVGYPTAEWLDRFARPPSKIIRRVVGEYYLFAVGVQQKGWRALLGVVQRSAKKSIFDRTQDGHFQFRPRVFRDCRGSR
jgi:hypothetical protein